MTLAESVAQEITLLISKENRFAPGDKLPNEQQFAKELFVSRATLREAIKILCERGIVVVKRGSGTYVNTFPQKKKALDFENQETYVDALELNEMRLIVEPEIAFYSALRATAVDIERMEKFAQDVEKCIHEGIDRKKEEQRFHLSIVSSIHNRFANQLMYLIYDAIDHSHNTFILVKDESIPDHRLIIDCIKEKNAEGARSAMRAHILRGIYALKKDS